MVFRLYVLSFLQFTSPHLLCGHPSGGAILEFNYINTIDDVGVVALNILIVTSLMSLSMLDASPNQLVFGMPATLAFSYSSFTKSVMCCPSVSVEQTMPSFPTTTSKNTTSKSL